MSIWYEFTQSRPGFHPLSSPSKALTVTQTQQVSRRNGPCGCGPKFLMLFESTVTSLRKKGITAKKTRSSNQSFTKRSALVGYARSQGPTNQKAMNTHESNSVYYTGCYSTWRSSKCKTGCGLFYSTRGSDASATQATQGEVKPRRRAAGARGWRRRSSGTRGGRRWPPTRP